MISSIFQIHGQPTGDNEYMPPIYAFNGCYSRIDATVYVYPLITDNDTIPF